MYTFLSSREEWDVFKILCPKNIIDIYLDENICKVDKNKIVYMLNALGFHALAAEYAHLSFTNGEDDVSSGGMKKNAVLFIKMFLENIKSDGLRDKFSETLKEIMLVNIVDEWQRSIIGMHQEWEIFKTLCPKEFMCMIEKENKSHDEHMTLVIALENLGFSNMSDDIYIMEYAPKYEDDNVSEEVFNKSAEYVKMFIDNIRSNGLKDIFAVKL